MIPLLPFLHLRRFLVPLILLLLPPVDARKRPRKQAFLPLGLWETGGAKKTHKNNLRRGDWEGREGRGGIELSERCVFCARVEHNGAGGAQKAGRGSPEVPGSLASGGPEKPTEPPSTSNLEEYTVASRRDTMSLSIRLLHTRRRGALRFRPPTTSPLGLLGGRGGGGGASTGVVLHR